jgi:endoglucanase
MPGWNLGNQLEANSGGTPSETAWGNPVITEKLIKQVKAQGFKSIRIPVSYLSKIGAGPNYTIDSKWLDRVQEVVDMCIDNGLYAIINIHGDGYYSIKGGWLLCAESASEQKTIKAKYEKVWEQIAKRFKNYDEHLVFESMNEEFDGTYNTPNREYYDNINAYNQIFVDTVRKAGGKNNSRYLLVPGWNTDINYTAGDYGFKIPNDSTGRLMISVHYYDPWKFCGGEEAPGIFRWGDSIKGQAIRNSGEKHTDAKFDQLYDAFISKGYGVIIGEYGAIDKTYKDSRSTAYRAYFAEYVNYAAHKRNIVTVYWDNGYNGDNGFGIFDRKSCKVTQPEIIKGIINGAKATKAPKAVTE